MIRLWHKKKEAYKKEKAKEKDSDSQKSPDDRNESKNREKTGRRKETAQKKPLYRIKFQDSTAALEREILRENPPRLSCLARLFRYVFSSARLMCGIFLGLAVLLSLLQPVTAFLWGKYVDGANAYPDAGDAGIAALLSLMGLALLYWLIRFLSGLLERYLYGGEDIERLSKVQDHRLQEKFQARLFEKIAGLYPECMEVPRINDMIDRCFDSMGSEWSSLQRGVMIEGYVIIAKLVSVVMVAASLYLFHPLLCLVVLIAPIPTLYTTYVGNRLEFRFHRDNQELWREANYYQGLLLGHSAKEIKAFHLFDFFFGKWKAIADDYVIREKRNQRNIFLLGTASGLISNLANAGANILAIVLLTQGRLSVGALGAVFSLIGTLMGSTSQLFGSAANFLSKKNEAAQFFELIDLREQPQNPSSAQGQENASHTPHGGPGPGVESLEARDISYRYPLTDQYRIQDVSFSIGRGEKVAFVGENGAGKTTFVKLLTGMLEPSAGSVLLNGRSLKELGYRSKYSSQSCVFQEPARFQTFTVADNVFLGDVDRDRSEEQIDEALSFSGFEGAEKNALLGKDIGGTDLSGGQWQKLAIARAYYRGRDFMVLDEPTSNLDPIAETEIFRKYLALARGKTVIMVTHRISVASLADRIVVFKEGRIVEDGSHPALLAKGGEYARLYSTQAQWYDR